MVNIVTCKFAKTFQVQLVQICQLSQVRSSQNPSPKFWQVCNLPAYTRTNFTVLLSSKYPNLLPKKCLHDCQCLAWQVSNLPALLHRLHAAINPSALLKIPAIPTLSASKPLKNRLSSIGNIPKGILAKIPAFRIFPRGFWQKNRRWEYYQRVSGFLRGVGNITNGISAAEIGFRIFPMPPRRFLPDWWNSGLVNCGKRVNKKIL